VQKQQVYDTQAKYNTKIDELEAKIREFKAARDKEVKAVLTPEQKKRLEEILLGKDK
jgi:Spy/CpxP family protein refolding chaperone